VATQAKGINPEVTKAVNKILKDVMKDSTASLLDKLKVIDRALKLEAIKQREDGDQWGSGFMEMEDEKGEEELTNKWWLS